MSLPEGTLLRWIDPEPGRHPLGIVISPPSGGATPDAIYVLTADGDGNTSLEVFVGRPEATGRSTADLVLDAMEVPEHPDPEIAAHLQLLGPAWWLLTAHAAGEHDAEPVADCPICQADSAPRPRMRPRITDYWDTRVDAIETNVGELDRLSGVEYSDRLKELSEEVAEHARALSDEWLIEVCAPFADDLYKAASSIGFSGGSLSDYLAATAGTLSSALTERGLRIQYLVDNAWPDPTRLLELFPEWYSAAGFVLCAPQGIAVELARQAGVAEHELAMRAGDYEPEARDVVNSLVARCQEEGCHFIQVDADAQPGSYEQALKYRGKPGVVTIVRDQASEPGSTVTVLAPEGHRRPT